MAFLSSTERDQVVDWWSADKSSQAKIAVLHYAYACDNPACHYATEFPQRYKPIMPFLCRKCGHEISLNPSKAP